MLVILSRGTLQNILILTMKTLLATTTGNAGPEMRAWDLWSMMLILGVQCSGTSRTACQDLSPHSTGMKALCLCTARTTQIFFLTCVVLNVASCPSVAQHLRSSRTEMGSGICKMRCALSCFIKCIFMLKDPIYNSTQLQVVGLFLSLSSSSLSLIMLCFSKWDVENKFYTMGKVKTRTLCMPMQISKWGISTDSFINTLDYFDRKPALKP